MQIVLLRLEALQKLLNEIDHRLAFEVFPDVQLIYGKDHASLNSASCPALVNWITPTHSIKVYVYYVLDNSILISEFHITVDGRIETAIGLKVRFWLTTFTLDKW